MSSVLLQTHFESVTNTLKHAVEGGQMAASDLHEIFQYGVNTLIDQGTQWGVNPVSAAVTGGSAATAVFSAWRGYHAFANKVIGPSLGWSMLMGTAGWVLAQSAPQTFRLGM